MLDLQGESRDTGLNQNLDLDWLRQVADPVSRHVLFPVLRHASAAGQPVPEHYRCQLSIRIRADLPWRGSRLVASHLDLPIATYEQLPVLTAEERWRLLRALLDDGPSVRDLVESGGDGILHPDETHPRPIGEWELEAIEARVRAASPGPWTSYVEGRDHWGGDDFIRISEQDDQPDMYVSRHGPGSALRPASTADQDFIAAARQDIPRLLAEIRRLRSTKNDRGADGHG